MRQEWSPGYQINSSAADGTGPQGPGDFNNPQGHTGCKQMDYDSCDFWSSPGIQACYMIQIEGDQRMIEQACGDSVKHHRIIHEEGEYQDIMYACLAKVDNAARHLNELSQGQRLDYMAKQMDSMCDGESDQCDLTTHHYKFCVGEGGESNEAGMSCVPNGLCPPECLGCPSDGSGMP